MLHGLLVVSLKLFTALVRLTRWTVGRSLQAVGLAALLVAAAHPRQVRRFVGPALAPHLRSLEHVLLDLEHRLHPPVPIADAPPIHWPVNQSRVSSGFGDRVNPVTGARHVHRGVDLPVPIGTPVRASRGGVVEKAREDGLNGKYVVVRDDAAGLRFAYCHLSELHVTEGQRVAAKTVVGASGNTGRSTGPHLHFGTWFHGRAVDPLRLRAI